MEQVLPALLECCVMTKADRIGDMPTKADDGPLIEAKQMVNVDDEGNDEEEEEEDTYMTLRKSSAFTLELFSKNFGDEVFVKM